MPSTPESEETRPTDAEVEAAARAHRKRVCERVYSEIYPRLAEQGIPAEGTEVARCIEPDEWEQTLARNPETIQNDLDDMRAALEAAAALHRPPADAQERCEDYDNDVTAVYHALSLPRCKNAAAQTVDGRRVCFTHAYLADLAAALHPPREDRLRQIEQVVGGTDEAALRRLNDTDPLVHALMTLGRQLGAPNEERYREEAENG